MGRAKVPMKLITCENRRNRVFQNRRKGLSKKCRELSLLCGIDVCMISLGPPGKRRFEQETYPREEDEVKRIIEEYRRSDKGKNNGKNHYTVASMLKAKAEKMEEELVADDDGGSSAPVLSWDEKILEGMTEKELREMAANLDAKLASVKQEIQTLNAAAGNVIEGKMEEPGNPQYSNLAMFDQEIGTVGCNQMIPCMTTTNPYGVNLCEYNIKELHQVQPLSIDFNPNMPSYLYDHEYYGKNVGNCVQYCNEDPLLPLPAPARWSPELR